MTERKDILDFQMERFNQVKTSVLPQLIYALL